MTTEILRNRYRKYYDHHYNGSGLIGDAKRLYDAFNINQKYKGERHAPLLVDDKIIIANYEGPGTQIIKRLQDDDKPITFSDQVSKLHDIQYAIAQSSNNKKEQLRRVRIADLMMIDQLKRGAHLDNPINIELAKNAISSKVLIENLHLPFISSKLRGFAGDLHNYTDDEMKLLHHYYYSTLNHINKLLK